MKKTKTKKKPASIQHISLLQTRPKRHIKIFFTSEDEFLHISLMRSLLLDDKFKKKKSTQTNNLISSQS